MPRESRSSSVETNHARPLNIIIFGEAGVGKSSLINLIIGKGVAKVSDDATPCTVESAKYTFSLPGSHRDLNLYDTIGLNDPTLDNAKYLDAVVDAQNLILSLQKTGGVHGLLFCIGGRRISDSVQRNNKLFYKSLCKEKVPVALVITGLENEAGAMDDWWVRNQAGVKKSGVTSVAHACITTIKGYNEADEQKYSESRTKMLNVLSVLGSGTSPTADSSVEADHPQLPNIIVFGETGAGKSSLINLIAGKKIANYSADAQCCTLKLDEYEIDLPDRQLHVRLFDTLGFTEPLMSGSGYLDALVKAHELIISLEKAGGIHGLLYCIRGSKISSRIEQNYKLFHEFLCQRNVPVTLVITGLENEDDMDDWWKRNQAHIKGHGISPNRHVCITSTMGYRGALEEKYSKSREKMLKALSELARGTAYSEDVNDWFIRVGRKLQEFLEKDSRPTREKVMRMLTMRCKLSKEGATELLQGIMEN